MAVYDSPAEIREAGLSEVTLELSALDSAEIMSRLVVITHHCRPFMSCSHCGIVYSNTSLMIKLEQVTS